MAFTIADAKALSETWASVFIDTNQALVWGNEFMRRKVDRRVWPEAETDFTDSAAGTWYSLPTDFEAPILITDKDVTGLILNHNHYAIRNRKIMFNVTGSYTLVYRQFPAVLASINSSLSIPDDFLDALSEYMLFRFFKIYVDDESFQRTAAEYEARCNDSLKAAYGNMELDSETESFRPVLRW